MNRDKSSMSRSSDGLRGIGIAVVGLVGLTLAAAPARAAVGERPPTLELVATAMATSQAIVWDVDLNVYFILELDDTYRGVTVTGVGRDFIALRTKADTTIVKRLVAKSAIRTAPLHMAPEPVAERVPVTFLPEVDVSDVATEAVLETISGTGTAPDAGVGSPSTSGARTAPPSSTVPLTSGVGPTPGAPSAGALPPAPPAPAARPPVSVVTPPVPAAGSTPTVAAAPAVPTMLSRTAIRDELSATIAGDRPYLATPMAGGYALSGLSGTALERAGLRDGDVIRSVNGIKATSYSAMMRAYAMMYTADAIEIELEREGRPLAMRYKLAI